MIAVLIFNEKSGGYSFSGRVHVQTYQPVCVKM